VQDTDTLMDNVLEQFDQESPGVQAQVEQIAARINQELRDKGLEPDRPLLRRYFAQVIAQGLAENVGPEPSRASSVLGMQLAGVCLLRRQVEERAP
jgi:hypothetical protein